MENEEKEKQEKKVEVKNPALKLAKQLQENRKKPDLIMDRVPEKTRKQFQELAHLEFCGDYGMTLKWLMDDLLSADTRMIVAKLQDQEARLQALESNDSTIQEAEPERESGIKMLDGKVRKVKKKK